MGRSWYHNLIGHSCWSSGHLSGKMLANNRRTLAWVSQNTVWSLCSHRVESIWTQNSSSGFFNRFYPTVRSCNRIPIPGMWTRAWTVAWCWTPTECEHVSLDHYYRIDFHSLHVATDSSRNIPSCLHSNELHGNQLCLCPGHLYSGRREGVYMQTSCTGSHAWIFLFVTRNNSLCLWRSCNLSDLSGTGASLLSSSHANQYLIAVLSNKIPTWSDWVTDEKEFLALLDNWHYTYTEFHERQETVPSRRCLRLYSWVFVVWKKNNE